jgi:hypothetical protein
MKKLIYLLLFSTVGFAQNYQYALSEAPIKTVDKPQGVNNQLEEIEYFKAYLLPIEKKATLQQALDTYGAVRLGKGDYSGVDIVLKSDQRLYGHPSLTRVGNITIAAGSNGVVLMDLFPSGKNVTFQAGGVISNCTLKSIKWATLKATNAMVEKNTFINILSRIDFDCSQSGYFRNNKIIKHQVHGHSNQLILKGNNITPSYGNVHLWSNFLTPAGDATNIDNLKSATFVGLDSEAWNFSGTGTKAMMYMRNMGDVKFTDLGGANGYSTVQTAPLDIVADKLFLFNKYIQGQGSSPLSKISAKTNVFYVNGEHDDYVRDGIQTGIDFKAYFTSGTNKQNVVLNGVTQSTTITSSSALTSVVSGPQYTPWERPTWETLPDPLGSNWKTERIGKVDQSSYLQNLIDTNGIATLPEGVFYISSTLKIKVDGTKGIIGQGTGKTVLVGLNDDFPLITLSESATGDNNFLLSNLTLQGGSVGIHAPDEMDLIAFSDMKYVVFRNQKYGIQLHWIFGLDNCFFDHISFVDCNIGFFQDPNPVYTFANAGYVDKVVFYGCQFINCNKGVSMFATRADNLNAWVDCKFERNILAIEMGGNNFPILANCDIVNNSGDYTIWGEMSLYNCKFQGNTVAKSTFMARNLNIEGCNFLDNSNMFPNERHYGVEYFILNSTITGNVVRSYGLTHAFYSNSKFLSNPTFSKLLVNIKNNVPTVLMDMNSNPYPQLLVTQ